MGSEVMYGMDYCRCHGCWLVEENCACELWKKADNVNKVVVHIHHGEW